MKLLITFIVLLIINVVFSTVRSITSIKSGETVASLISGGYFSFYNIMLIYTVADFPMWEKCVITFVCNVIGVYIVKLIEERMRKDKLWKVEMTIEEANTESLEMHLTELGIPHNYIMVEKYSIFNAYCQTQKESALVKELGNRYNAKFFVTETKTL